jgi:hypothetical protein
MKKAIDESGLREKFIVDTVAIDLNPDLAADYDFVEIEALHTLVFEKDEKVFLLIEGPVDVDTLMELINAIEKEPALQE